MEFVDKYLMPHKRALMLLLAITFIPLGGIVGYLAVLVNFGTFIWIGFDGQRRLGYDFRESVKTAFVIGALFAVLMIVFRIVTLSPKPLDDTIRLDIFSGIGDGILVLIGYVIARYLAPKQPVASKTKHKPVSKRKD